MDVVVITVIFILVIAAEIAVYRRFGLYGIEYRVYLSKKEAREGDEIEIIEEVLNKKFLPVPWLKSEIFTSRWLDFAGTKANAAAGSRFAPSVFALRPNQKCVRKWRVKCLKRGVFHLEDTSIVTCDVFGFVTRSVKIKVNESVTVLPVPIVSDEKRYSDRMLFGQTITRRFVCDDPFLISGTREYSGIEPLNRIHWNSAAKEGRLMVYNNDYTTHNTVLVMLNAQRGDGGLIPPPPADIEIFIKVAAFIIDKCALNRFRAGFISNGGSRSGVVSYPADKVYSNTEILRGLAAFDERECFADFGEAARRVDFSVYTDAAIITAFVSPRLLKTADMLKNAGINVFFYSDCGGGSAGDYKVIPLRGRRGPLQKT
ncbi:MAG: DUF58 domain-containing protein [Oscillospiraceae bacterium]|jgi:uncharacterized protein (DUF58 family)|nr:DUF58 domain-containing protein [Oscillospiraceae bacterium]